MMGYIFWVLLMPNALLGYNVAHISSSLALIGKKPVLTYKNNAYTLIFLLYICYVSLRLIAYFLFNLENAVFDDLSEVKRIFLLVISYLLARKYNIEKSRFLTIAFCLAIILYFLGSNIYSEGVRFSGFMPSVNYVWVSVLFLVLKGGDIVSKYDTVILSIIALSLSGSLTSIVVCGLFLILSLLFYNKIKYSYILYFSIPASIIIYLVISNNILVDFTYQVNKLTTAYQLFIEGNLTEFKTFQARLLVWKDLIPIILDEPLFGHGVSKNFIRYTDNQYLMTAFRYGLVGLLIELVLLFAIFYKAIKSKKFYYVLFVIGIFVSGITAHSIYEIKTIPILGLIIGELFKFNHQVSNEK